MAQAEFIPSTQTLLDYGFKTMDLNVYTRDCERGQIQYARYENRFFEKEYLEKHFRQIKVTSLEEMKAYIWAMNEAEV